MTHIWHNIGRLGRLLFYFSTRELGQVGNNGRGLKVRLEATGRRSSRMIRHVTSGQRRSAVATLFLISYKNHFLNVSGELSETLRAAEHLLHDDDDDILNYSKTIRQQKPRWKIESIIHTVDYFDTT